MGLNMNESKANPNQRDELANVMIRASAGTGKTFQLSNRYLKLLIAGVDCQEILATTFSRKGAGEILDRVVKRIAEAALSDDAAKELSNQLKVDLPRSKAAEVLQQLMKNLHRLEIGTLDSFFNRVAKAFSLELGLLPGWGIVEEQQMDRLRTQTIQQILHNDRVPELLHLMNKGQSSRRIATLILDTVQQIYKTRRDSTKEAWDQLPEPTGFLSDADVVDVIAQTENSTFDTTDQLKKYWKEKVVPIVSAENWADVASLTVLQNVVAENPKYSRTKLPPEMLFILERLIPHCRAWITKRLIEQNRSTCELLGDFRDIIEKIKDDTGQLRFDDVTERLLKFVPMWDTGRFSFRLDHQIKHLLLDEFQDTSPHQWSIIRPFAEKICSDSDATNSFFCVGDMKQAIYGWRGGVAEIFDLVNVQLTGVEKMGLSTSYRSSQPIVDFTNEVFSNLNKYESKNEVVNRAVHSWTKRFDLHHTAKEELSGYATLEYAADAKITDESIPHSRRREIITRRRNDNVKIATVQRIREILKQVGNEEHSIGVLVRSNAEVAEMIFLLQQEGIPASEEGGNPLTDSAAVELILSALKLADHPGDSIARFHVSHSPLADLFGLDPEDPTNRTENAKVAAASAAKMRRRLVTDGYGPTVESMARLLANDCTVRELSRLQHLVRIAFANRSDSERWAMRPNRFVNYVRDEIKISDESSAQVKVMTIHRSKGLEFDSVILPQRYTTQGWIGATNPVIIGRRSPTAPIEIVCRYANETHRNLLPPKIQEIFEQDRERTVRESLCVLYVAITRAVHSVHVILSYSSRASDNSAAGLLLAALYPEAGKNQQKKDKDGRKEGVIFETGDREWFTKLEKPASNETKEQQSDQRLSKFYLESRTERLHRPLATTVKSLRGVKRVVPSALGGGTKIKLSDTLMTDEKEIQFEVGRLLHGCYETLTWLEEGEPTTDQLAQRLHEIEPGSRLIPSAIKSFQESLEHENILNLVSKSSYEEQFALLNSNDGDANRLELFNEKPFAVILNEDDSPNREVLVQGVIDRLVLVYENNELVAADVIDFKSDVITDENLTERISFYRPQIETYRSAVAKFAGLNVEKVSAKLVFVKPGHVVNLNLLDRSIDGQSQLTVQKKVRPIRKNQKPVASKKSPKQPDPTGKVREVGKTKKPKAPKFNQLRQKTLWSDDPE